MIPNAIRKIGDTRRRQIQQLRSLGKELDLLYRKFNGDKIKGNGTSLVGGGLTIVMGLTTLVTGGFAVPFLGGLGTVCGVVGGVWNISGARIKIKREQEIFKRIDNILLVDEDLQETIRHVKYDFEICNDYDRYKLGEEILLIMKGWGMVAIPFGPRAAMDVLSNCICSIGEHFGASPVVTAVLKTTVSGLAMTAKELGDDVFLQHVKEAGKKLPNNWTKPYIMRNAYGEMVKKAGEETVVTLKEEGAQKAAETIGKCASNFNRIVGGITTGIGAFVCAWDIYQISEALGPSKEGSRTSLGIELGNIADELEKSMTMRGNGSG